MKLIAEETAEQKEFTVYASRENGEIKLRLVCWGPIVVMTMSAGEAKELALVLNTISESETDEPTLREGQK